jgi:hypothetical protein
VQKAVGEVLAATQTPARMPLFLRHIPEFRRMAIPIKDTPDKYQRIQDAAKKFSFEVQDGVACQGCVEP